MTAELRDLIAQLAAELEQLADHACTYGQFDTCTKSPDCVRRRGLLARARVAAPVYVCGGRALNDQGQPKGEPCGRTFNPRKASGDGAVIAGMARAAGWKLGPIGDDGRRDVICPRCAKPSATVVKLCDDLTASLQGAPDAAP